MAFVLDFIGIEAPAQAASQCSQGSLCLKRQKVMVFRMAGTGDTTLFPPRLISAEPFILSLTISLSYINLGTYILFSSVTQWYSTYRVESLVILPVPPDFLNVQILYDIINTTYLISYSRYS